MVGLEDFVGPWDETRFLIAPMADLKETEGMLRTLVAVHDLTAPLIGRKFPCISTENKFVYPVAQLGR